MFRFNFELLWPWFKTSNTTKNYFWKSFKISKFKSLEIQIYKWEEFNSLFIINLDVSTKRDHAGINFVFELLNHGIDINLFDVRHWDYELDRWE